MQTPPTGAQEAKIKHWSVMFANTICPSELKFKSILSHQHTLLFGLHYLLQSLHYSFHFASHFIPGLIHKEPLTVMIVIITPAVTTSLYFWDEHWRLCGFVVFVWHARFYLRPVTPKPRIQPGAKRHAPPPEDTTQLLSALCVNSASAETSWKSPWHVTEGICGLKTITGRSIISSGLRGRVPNAQAIFWPRLDVYGLSKLQVVSPALVVVPPAWHRHNYTRLEVSQSEV